MTRAIPPPRLVVAVWLLASACSGPTKPSPAPAAASSAVLSFVDSDPAPGSEMSLVDSAGLLLLPLKVRLAIRYEATLPDAKIQVDLLNAAGQQCAYGFVDQPITANQSVTAVNSFWDWQGSNCGDYPIATATIKATLLTLREPVINGRLQRTDYATTTFPIRYAIRRYPPAPGGPATPPAITALTWHVDLPVGGDPPIAGDPVTITCTAQEADGAALTTTITLTWDTLAPQRYTQYFPAGASSSPAGARYAIGVSAPNLGPGALHAKIDCVTVNDRGQDASKTVDMGQPK